MSLTKDSFFNLEGNNKMSKNLANYDYGVAVDKSGSMSNPGIHAPTRWDEAQETTQAVANKAAQYDTNGIDVIPFNNSHKIYQGVLPSAIAQIFVENDPMGGTDTASMLSGVFAQYLASDRSKPYLLVVITDGEPNDKDAVKQVIRDFAEQLRPNEAGDDTDEFGLLFLQVGNDVEATAFLHDLDNNLNAKFDIVDTKTFDEAENMPLAELLLQALEG
jgi:hypothetical protein